MDFPHKPRTEEQYDELCQQYRIFENDCTKMDNINGILFISYFFFPERSVDGLIDDICRKLENCGSEVTNDQQRRLDNREGIIDPRELLDIFTWDQLSTYGL